MNEILALSLQAMQQDAARLTRIGGNIGNVSTAGYKREVTASRPFGQMVTEGVAGTSPQFAAQSLLDVRPGTLRATGQALDLALSGPGFFSVRTATGAVAYTRQGTFSRDAEGRLVNASGSAVLGESGDIRLPGAQVFVDATGRVFDRSAPGVSDVTPVAQLVLVQVENPQSLHALGQGLFSADEGVSPLATGATQVKQGYLENSNVSTMTEMVDLMQTMRHFESMQKVALGYDELMGLAVRKLGELS